MEALAILGLIQSGLATAPDVIKFASTTKDFILALFTAKAITAEQQNALNAEVDARCAARLRGELPSHWQVEADPT